MAKRLLRKSQVRAFRNAFRVIEKTLLRVAQLSLQPIERRDRGTRRRLKLTAARRAALKLQGRYMGYVRRLKPREKARIRAVKHKRGYRAAIRLAKQLARQ